MRVIICATWAELRASGLLDLDDAEIPPRFVLVNLRLHRNPYTDAYRLYADVLDPHPKEVR